MRQRRNHSSPLEGEVGSHRDPGEGDSLRLHSVTKKAAPAPSPGASRRPLPQGERYFSFLVGLVVSISLLAGCGPREPASTGGPAVVRRLTEDQYRHVIADIFGADIAVAGRFDPLNRTDGLLDLGSARAAITPASYEQFDSMAHQIASQVLDERHRDILVPCKPAREDAPDDACAGQFLGKVGRLLYRRPLKDRELQAMTGLAHQATAALGDFHGGLAYGLAGLLEAPSFLLVRDTSVDDPERPGSRHLDAYSKASRLSFLLWDSAPDDMLLNAAASGDLDSRTGLARQVDRMLTSPRLETGVRAFFADMLGFDGFDTLAKDQVIYPAFTQPVGGDAAEQTLRTVTDLLVRRNADYRDLFTTRETFLSRRLGALYRMPVGATEGWERVDLPDGDPRVGIATQVSFVALHSHPGRSSPTLRGKAVREILLCQKVPDPPANVDFALVQDTRNPNFRTARERLTAHRTQATCAGCHKIMDPIGLALENFDGAGQYRDQENGAPIDASGELDGTTFRNAHELGQALHDDPAATACLVRRLYEYGTGRVPAKGETELLAWLGRDFAAHGYQVSELLRRIATSDAFYAVSPSSEDSR